MWVTCINEEAGDFKRSAGGDARYFIIFYNFYATIDILLFSTLTWPTNHDASIYFNQSFYRPRWRCSYCIHTQTSSPKSFLIHVRDIGHFYRVTLLWHVAIYLQMMTRRGITHVPQYRFLAVSRTLLRHELSILIFQRELFQR